MSTGTGTILFYMTKQDGKSFGFIEPDDAPGIREANLWFSDWALSDGVKLRTGSRVKYEAGPFRNGKGPSAKRVWLIGDAEEITTLQGEFET